MTNPSPDARRAAVADAVGYFDSWLAFRRRYQRIPGIQVAILDSDEVVLSTAHGLADLEADTPLTPRHLFRVASHSKTFTATALLQLAERDIVRLDDTAGHWLPFLRDTALASVTIRELLAHGAGVIRDGREDGHWQLFRPFPDASRLREIGLDHARVVPANERFKYSNIGYGLLGMIIAEATKQSYNAYAREHIVERLGLTDTGPEHDPTRTDEYAAAYSALSYADRRIPIEHVDTAAMAAATGFYSTAHDLVRYAAAHFVGDDRLLTDDSKRRAQRTEWTVDDGPDGYGLGFAITEVRDRRIVGHAGGYPGHSTITWFDPVDRLAVSVLTNAIDGGAKPLSLGFWRLLDLAERPPEPDAPAPKAELSRFCGRFANLWGVRDIAELGGRLYLLDPTVDDPTELPSPLAVVDERTLRIVGGSGTGSYGEELVFEFDDAGVSTLRGVTGSLAYPYERFAAAAADRDEIRLGRPLTP